MVTNADFRPELLDYLPAIYRRSEQIRRFLSAFEATLFGTNAEQSHDADQSDDADQVHGAEAHGDEQTRDAGQVHGVERAHGVQRRDSRKSLLRLVDGIPELFDPEDTPTEFLPWLAQWAALTAYEGIPEARSRQLIYKIIPLYGIRGTKSYLESVLRLYTGAKAVVTEDDLPGMKVGVHATVGVDSRLGQDPFQFHVFLDLLSFPELHGRLDDILELAKLVINLAKPAHTHYKLVHNVTGGARGLVIFVRSTVGLNTLLWHDDSTTMEVAQ